MSAGDVRDDLGAELPRRISLLLFLLPINVARSSRSGNGRGPTEEGWATNLRHAFLPAFTLALAEAPVFTRLLRSDIVATLQEDFILAARAKGMPTWHILLREALRPSSFSLLDARRRERRSADRRHDHHRAALHAARHGHG